MHLSLSQDISRQVDASDLCINPLHVANVDSFKTIDSRPSLPNPVTVQSRKMRGAQQAREAVLLTFSNPQPQHCASLQSQSETDWRHLLRWLDVSGLALYFLDRVNELKLRQSLPPLVLSRLEQNLIDNTERTRAMIAESVSIQQAFQESRLSYANLKGFSLRPTSVPRLELRSQFDLDFLVAEKSAAEAQRILEERGYRLYAVSGRSWEFKLNEKPGVSLRDLYKNFGSHAVELHIEADAPGHPAVLENVDWRDLGGIRMPVLSPVYLVLGQGLHAYKHVCGEFLRASHLLEFRRHVLARRDDDGFWGKVQETAQDNQKAYLGLGVVTLLITQVMGEFAPEALTDWTVCRLPKCARLWVEMYGQRVVFGSIPGSKLYLLLQRELATGGVPAKRSIGRALLPLRLPPPVIRAFPNERVSVRFQRWRMQLSFLFVRLRFHIVEGLRYLWASYQWRNRINRSTE